MGMRGRREGGGEGGRKRREGANGGVVNLGVKLRSWGEENGILGIGG